MPLRKSVPDPITTMRRECSAAAAGESDAASGAADVSAVDCAIHPPSLKAERLERHLAHVHAHLGHALADGWLSIEAAVQEHVATAAGAGDLAADGAFLERRGIKVVQLWR